MLDRDAAVGRLGEALVADELRRAGWRVLGRRVRTARAELDLLLERGDVLRVVEVKTARRAPRAGGLEPPRERLGPHQRQRLERAARQAAGRLGHRRLRLTLALCTLGLRGAPARSRPSAPVGLPARVRRACAHLRAAAGRHGLDLTLEDCELLPHPGPGAGPDPDPVPDGDPGFTPWSRSVDG